jgi:Carboxypeptidase regulatory-like domain
VRGIRFHCTHVYAGWLVGVLTTLSALAACHGGPVVDLGPKPVEADGTISGTVRGPEGTTAIDSRSVEVINVDTGERQRATTNNAGGFTFKVKPGKYRVEVALQDGETIVKKPDVINVNRSDVDAHADFVLGVPRASRPSRPRTRVPRADDGLGSAIA